MEKALPRRLRAWLPIAVLIWAPVWLIGAIAIGGRSAAWIGITAALAPFALGLLWLWAILIAVIRTPTNAAFAIVFGVPVLLFIFGEERGLIAVAVSAAWWMVSRPLLRWRYARELAHRESSMRVRPTPHGLAWGSDR